MEDYLLQSQKQDANFNFRIQLHNRFIAGINISNIDSGLFQMTKGSYQEV